MDLLPDNHALPEMHGFKACPKTFSDNTNHIWEAVIKGRNDGCPVVIKLCYSQEISDCPFWQGMRLLFALDYPMRMESYKNVYALMTQYSPLKIPAWVASHSGCEDLPGMLVTEKVAGVALQENQVDSDVITLLADHLGRLHQNTCGRFGSLSDPVFPTSEWADKVRVTIETMAGGRGCSLGNHAVELQNFSEHVFFNEERFVPTMPDLRWDQFLMEGGQLHALVDLDAMVWADRRLEFVLLEYLLGSLDSELTETFIEGYQQYHSIPKLTEVRTIYRLLLFFMNVLGEESMETWMKAPTLFD